MNILKNENILYSFSEIDKNIILNSVLYHNKLTVPIIDCRTNLFITLIREADRLDIIKEQGLSLHDNYKLNDKIKKLKSFVLDELRKKGFLC